MQLALAASFRPALRLTKNSRLGFGACRRISHQAKRSATRRQHRGISSGRPPKASGQRFTAKDPILFAGGDTNVYAYCGNDPVNCTDPTGLWVAGIGGEAAGQFIFSGVSFAAYHVVDGHGNVGYAFVGTGRAGVSIGGSFGVDGFFYPTMDSISDLGGFGFVSGADLLVASVNWTSSLTDTTCGPGDSELKNGVEASGGLGLMGGFFAGATYTKVVSLFNLSVLSPF